jgi:hypothetical protein
MLAEVQTLQRRQEEIWSNDSCNHGFNTESNCIRIYGCPTPRHVYLFLDNKVMKESEGICNENIINAGDFRS